MVVGSAALRQLTRGGSLITPLFADIELLRAAKLKIPYCNEIFVKNHT